VTVNVVNTKKTYDLIVTNPCGASATSPSSVVVG
jgi:hypothetical protein